MTDMQSVLSVTVRKRQSPSSSTVAAAEAHRIGLKWRQRPSNCVERPARRTPRGKLRFPGAFALATPAPSTWRACACLQAGARVKKRARRDACGQTVPCLHRSGSSSSPTTT